MSTLDKLRESREYCARQIAEHKSQVSSWKVAHKDWMQKLVVELKKQFDFDRLTAEEIQNLINEGVVKDHEVREYYNNEWWDEQP